MQPKWAGNAFKQQQTLDSPGISSVRVLADVLRDLSPIAHLGFLPSIGLFIHNFLQKLGITWANTSTDAEVNAYTHASALVP